MELDDEMFEDILKKSSTRWLSCILSQAVEVRFFRFEKNRKASLCPTGGNSIPGFK